MRDIELQLVKLSEQVVELEDKFKNTKDETMKMIYAIDLEYVNHQINKILDMYNEKKKAGAVNE